MAAPASGTEEVPAGEEYYLAAPGDGTALSEIGRTGAMVTGWLTDPSDGHRYYLDPVSGAMVTGERIMGGKRYMFNPASQDATGWHYDGTAEGEGGTTGQVGHWRFDGGSALPMGALMKEE